MKYTAVFLLLLSGCATQQLTPSGASVQPITPGVATTKNCKHLGMAQSHKPVLAGGLKAAQIDIRNKVAAAGGNAFVVSSQVVSSQGHAEIIADAYSC